MPVSRSLRLSLGPVPPSAPQQNLTGSIGLDPTRAIHYIMIARDKG